MKVTDTLPSELTLISCSATGGGVCDTSDATHPKVTFTSFPVGRTDFVTIVARINDSVPSGTFIENQAFLTATPSDSLGNNTDKVYVHVIANPSTSTLQFDAAIEFKKKSFRIEPAKRVTSM